MLKKQIKFDINSCISELSYQVKVENNTPFAYISFRNESKNILTAVKFTAKGFNSFGDIIHINNEETFLIILQDLYIEPNKMIRNIQIKLPSDDIRKLDIKENQYCFYNGDVIRYSTPNYIEFNIEEFDSTNADENLVLKAFREINPQTKNLPISLENGWVCSCGKFNCSKDEECNNCRTKKLEVFNLHSNENINTIIEEHYAKEKERKNLQNKARRNKFIKKASIGVAIYLVISLIINAMLLSGRVKYDSIEAMKSDLQGAWTSGNVKQLKIVDNTGIIRYYFGSEPLEAEIKWYPKRGCFKWLNNTYIVKPGRYLKEGSDYYEKGGVLKGYKPSY